MLCKFRGQRRGGSAFGGQPAKALVDTARTDNSLDTVHTHLQSVLRVNGQLLTFRVRNTILQSVRATVQPDRNLLVAQNRNGLLAQPFGQALDQIIRRKGAKTSSYLHNDPARSGQLPANYSTRSYAGFWVMRPDQAARFSVSFAATPSVNVTPSMTKGNWLAPRSRRHVFAAA